MSDTYIEKLVDVLEYLGERIDNDNSWLGASADAYEDVVNRLENLLSEMLSGPESIQSDRKTFIAYMGRKKQGEN
jgi:hypothetical protein